MFVDSVGIEKVRDMAGIAVRPDRSASRLLANSQISSLSLSEDSQSRGLMMMRVRYAGMPSSLIAAELLLLSLEVSHDEGVMASSKSMECNNDTGGFWCSCGRSSTGGNRLVQCQLSGLVLDERDRIPCKGADASGLEGGTWQLAAT